MNKFVDRVKIVSIYYVWNCEFVYLLAEKRFIGNFDGSNSFGNTTCMGIQLVVILSDPRVRYMTEETHISRKNQVLLHNEHNFIS